ncbi:MAG: NAD-dependent epimerase/dehydratase family protein [Gammaproteobacteria bacterium]|nr:NAD-dependent epimerase/dehydratase family protein [Gammaproteobacteria bacterium]
MPTLLVTGATGFVGSHILEALSQQSALRVIAACRDDTQLPESFAGEIRCGDMRDPAYRARLFEDVDIVCNAFAWTSVWKHRTQSHELLLRPSLAMIDAAKAAGVRRFINTSTTSAAAPARSHDPNSIGIPRTFWPHLCNVVAIENYLRQQADPHFQVINLRLGLFVGRRYGLGLLPMLLPRLRTHLVPWINHGKTSMPLIDGRDIGQAFVRAAQAPAMADYEGFNIVGPEIPSVREVLQFLHARWRYPLPHFSVPFSAAYAFAYLMERLDPLVPWDPLVTRSIVHLLEEVNVNNDKATRLLDYQARYAWRNAVEAQIQEIQSSPKRFINMATPLH